MKYLEPSFSVVTPGTDQYRDNWDRIFGKEPEPSEPPPPVEIEAPPPANLIDRFTFNFIKAKLNEHDPLTWQMVLDDLERDLFG